MSPIDLIAQLLLHSLWIVAVVAGLLACGLPLLPARWRHTAAISALALIGVGLAGLGVVLWSQASPAPAVISNAAVSTPVVLPSGVGASVVTGRIPETLGALTSEHAAWPWSHILVAVWCLGVAAIACWHAGGFWRLRRLRRSSTDLPEEIARHLPAWIDAAGLHCQIAVRMSAQVVAPCVVGMWRPLILVPAHLIGLPHDQFTALILHELAHVRRSDWIVNVLLVTVEAVLFFHPGIWWLTRVVRRERELLCDAAALRSGADPIAFARSLLALVERAGSRGDRLVLAANDGEVVQRVRRMLGADRPARRGARAAGPAALLLLAVILAACTVANGRTSAPPDTEHVAQYALMSSPPTASAGSAAAAAQAVPRAARIAALNRGTQITVRMRVCSVPLNRLQEPGMPTGIQVLDEKDRARLERKLSAWTKDGWIDAFSLTTNPLQVAYVTSLTQLAYRSDYVRSAQGTYDPEVSMLTYGDAYELRVDDPQPGIVQIDHLRLETWKMLGIEKYSVGAPNNALIVEEPILASLVASLDAPITVRAGQTVLIVPRPGTVQARQASIRDRTPNTQLGAAVPRALGEDALVTVVMLNVHSLPSETPDRIISTASEATGTMAKSVTLRARQITVSTALQELSKMVHLEADLHAVGAEADALVDIDAENVPFGIALRSVLKQTLLSAVISPSSLTCEVTLPSDFPARIGIPWTSDAARRPGIPSATASATAASATASFTDSFDIPMTGRIPRIGDRVPLHNPRYFRRTGSRVLNAMIISSRTPSADLTYVTLRGELVSLADPAPALPAEPEAHQVVYDVAELLPLLNAVGGTEDTAAQERTFWTLAAGILASNDLIDVRSRGEFRAGRIFVTASDALHARFAGAVEKMRNAVRQSAAPGTSTATGAILWREIPADSMATARASLQVIVPELAQGASFRLDAAATGWNRAGLNIVIDPKVLGRDPSFIPRSPSRLFGEQFELALAQMELCAVWKDEAWFISTRSEISRFDREPVTIKTWGVHELL